MSDNNNGTLDFAPILAQIKKSEGGWNGNAKTEPGGASNYGISMTTYADYKGRDVTFDELRKISNEEIHDVYYEKYFKAAKLDQIKPERQKSAIAIADILVNRPAATKRYAKSSLGLKADATDQEMVDEINKLDSSKETKFLTTYLSKVRDGYAEIGEKQPSKAALVPGWNKRVDKLAQTIGLPVDGNLVAKRKLAQSRVEESNKINTNRRLTTSTAVRKSTVADLLDKTEQLYNGNILANGQFRFNDIVLSIPPEQIQIHMDEYENSILLMRQETPVQAQSGKKRIRVIVQFAIDIANSYDELTRMIIQVKKTPIVTVENEKIRKEIYGDDFDTSNMAFVVDNLSGYVDDDYPTLFRCTLQMSWFNHVPYIEDIKYVEIINGIKKYQTIPSTQYTKFYTNKTSYPDGSLINDPRRLENPNVFRILYKEYMEKEGVYTAEKMQSSKSALDPKIKSVSHDNAVAIDNLRANGWYLAEEDDEKHIETLDGVFYRWRCFDIPMKDFLSESGRLILQNMSFSLSTNPSYIQMEHYAVPTVQFLGGSVADLRAILFAAAEYAEDSKDSPDRNRNPIESSKELGNLQMIIKYITDTRNRYPKYAKENHLLISHPMAKLMKYKFAPSYDFGYKYYDTLENVHDFQIDDFLPVIISSTDSATIPGLPYASKLQIDFKETRLAKAEKPIKYEQTTNSPNPFVVQRNLILTLCKEHNVAFDKQAKVFIDNSTKKGSPDYSIVEKVIKCLNASRMVDSTIDEVDKAFTSSMYLNPDEIKKLKSVNIVLKSEDGELKTDVERSSVTKTSFGQPLHLELVTQLILDFYAKFCTGFTNAEAWVKPYIKDFQDYTSVRPKVIKDLYPDMLLPEGEMNPSYYLADNKSRVDGIMQAIVKAMPGVNAKTAANIQERLLNKDFAKSISPDLMPVFSENFPLARNMAAMAEHKNKGTARLQDMNSEEYRIMAAQQAIASATPSTYTLGQAYPTFQIQLYSEKFSFFQKLSAEDMKTKDTFFQNQKDLLDIFDLSSIIDIRIIKDEYEAADLMIIRVLGTSKSLTTKQNKDPTFNPDEFRIFDEETEEDVVETNSKTGQKTTRKVKTKKPGLISTVLAGKSTANATYNANLEEVGLKEGVRIRAYLGYSNDISELGLEFSGRIAAINGKDVIEIYCISDGHELIQNTLGYDKNDIKEFTANSDTVNLITKLLANRPEVKSFGNTEFEVIRELKFDTPLFLGGRSAMDNVYAPELHPPGNETGNFIAGAIDTAADTFALASGVGLIFYGAAAIVSAKVLAILGLAAAVVGVGKAVADKIDRDLFPAPFSVFQQTIWDVLQELTLRHPGYICAIVPFDNRSTIYFGEPDGLFFYRGAESAFEKALKLKAITDNYDLDDGLNSNSTLREIYDYKAKFAGIEEIRKIGTDSTLPVARVDAKTRIDQAKKSALENSDITSLAFMAMQRTFRSYHIVTSEHDIISNNIEATSMGIANSVQVYHPVDSDDAEFSGAQYIKKYELTQMMKADDDLNSNLINNKIFTFHNAHKDYEGLHLPERYAKAVLCKELENIYSGKVTILGRPGIKPHDIVMLSDTHNKISGPIGVQRVVHMVSPSSGWTTSIYPKFIAIPDTVAGAFQLKSILKAARFWIAKENDLFYSSMVKFTPSENTGSSNFTDDGVRAVEKLNSAEQINLKDTEMRTVPKEYLGVFGENSAIATVQATKSAIENTAFIGVQVGSQVLAGALIDGKAGASAVLKSGGKALVPLVGQEAKIAGKSAKELYDIGNTVRKAKSLKGFAKPAAKIAITGLKAGAKTLMGVASVGASFAVENMIESKMEGLINYMRYREPIIIFPLNKDGKPWMAALNGFKENTPLESFQLAATQSADKMAMVRLLLNEFYGAWISDVPEQGNSDYVQVVKIVDGDTIDVRNGSTVERVRIYGIDTGETTKQYDKETGREIETVEKEIGQAAKDYLTNAIRNAGNVVSLRRLPNAKDARSVARVYVAGRDISIDMYNAKVARKYYGGIKDHLRAPTEDRARVRDKNWSDLNEQRKGL